MSHRFEWADISPKRAVLYLIRDDSTYNQKIAEVFYNELDKNGFVARLHDENNPLIGNWIAQAITDKQEAMKVALVEIIARRLDRANGIE